MIKKQKKIRKSFRIQEKTEEYIITNDIRYNYLEKDVGDNIYRHDNIFKETVMYPGVIGPFCKFRNFHELIDYFINEILGLIKYKEKNYIELLEEDLNIYKMFLEGGDYQKLLDEKKERLKLEKEEKERREKELLEEERKLDEERYFDEEEEEEDKNKKQDEEDDEKNENKKEEENDEKKEDENNEKEKDKNKEEDKDKDKEEKSTSEESEKDKIYNDVNFWKAEIMPTDDIMSAVLNDLD